MKFKDRVKNPEEMLDKALAQDNPENIPDMYNEDRFDIDRKYDAERWDR